MHSGDLCSLDMRCEDAQAGRGDRTLRVPGRTLSCSHTIESPLPDSPDVHNCLCLFLHQGLEGTNSEGSIELYLLSYRFIRKFVYVALLAYQQKNLETTVYFSSMTSTIKACLRIILH